VFQSVHYPDNYNPDRSASGDTYIVAHNLMSSVVIYSNGTIFTVGDSMRNIAEPTPNNARVIRRFYVSPVLIEKFKNFVYGSGFLNLPAAKDGDKSNLICDSFFYSAYSYHRVCRPESSTHPTIVSIATNIEYLLNNYTTREIYKPMKIFAETKFCSRKDVKTLITKTSRQILQDFDPEGKYMKSDYSFASYISFTSNYKLYNTIMEAANNQYGYTDGVVYFQFVVYIDGLSINDHPFPIYPDSTKLDYNRNDNIVWQIFLYGFLIIFFSFCVVFIIRRFYKRNNNSDSQEISIEDTNNESSNDQQPINPQMTSYPIFVQTNPQMTSYPIFVQTNPQMTTNGVPIVFPQPQVFYPMQTNNAQ